MSTFIKKLSRHVIAITLLFSLVLPNVAQAQLVVTDPLQTGQIILEYIGKVLKVAIKNVVVVGAVQLSQKLAKDAAESVATWVWEGAPGKNPLTYMEDPSTYVKNQGQRALGDLLDQMSSDVANANLLCVSDPTAALGVLGGLYTALKDKANVKPFGKQPGSVEFSPTPDLNLGKCDAASIAINYQSLTNELSSDELLKRFSNAATSGGTEVDQVVASQMQALTSLVREQKSAELARLNTKSYADQKSLISGEVVQTSDAVAEDAKINTAKYQQEKEDLMLSGILASGAEAIPSIFATTFANAISKKIIDKLKRGKGTNPIAAGNGINLSNIFGSGKTAGSGGAPTSLYSDTKTVTISEGELDLLSSFAACPDKFANIDNCVIDDGFAAAIRTADAGKPLTVKEAIEQDKLHGNFEMVPPAKSALNESRLCAKSAYCFSNLAKLRKARVIPIGWEIAAASADGTGKTTLKDVVNGFNQCSYVCSNDAAKTCKADSDCGVGSCTPTRTKENPFCHLIDPNWVLKMPEQICRAKVYGPQLQSDMGPERQEVCSDQASCLQEDSSGQCTGAFGYCLREKNTFRFEADECPAQYAGCRTYGNKTYGDISLVDSTIESGSCTDKNTGCMGYYADYSPTGLFDTNSQKVYLNEKAESCGLENIGCTEVTNAVSGKQQYLRLPPASLGCKGYSNDVTACKQYAQACTVDEVGCEVYQPIGSSDAAVPGVITAAVRDVNGGVTEWNDECSAECVGYSSYYQAPTKLEPIAAPATAFIPSSAKSCTQEVVGCDAYTNVDTAVKGGGKTSYFAQPQKCSDPDVESNHAIYYSWEGSDQSGYQLRQHDLVRDAGAEAPLYDVPQAELAAAQNGCTADIYKTRVDANGVPNPYFNTDCRELFDKAGKPFYRLLSKTLPSTSECVAFQKEKSDKANCIASNGVFNADTGSCSYGFLPSASTQCKVEEVGCRAYAGAAALSPKVVLNDEFGAITGWNGGETSNEGITVGDSVMKFAAAAEHSISLTQGKTYNVVFWAKGQASTTVQFVSAKNSPSTITLNAEPIVVGNDWRRFEVSSAPLSWSDVDAKIVFNRVSGSVVYIENLVVKEQADVVYAVRDSWVTPLSCDPIPSDNIPGPGLNCRAYKPKSQANSQPVYLTGFTNLCRAQSAGCQKFVSTQNTKEISARTVSFGKNSAGVEEKRTIPSDEFVYVIANSAASCPADKKGCSALGVKVNGKIETVAKINNPEAYETISCQVKDEWCQTFTTSGGTQRYFKYPDVEKQCEYREKVEKDGATYSGWFKKGTEKPCYDSFVSGGNTYGIYKNQDKNFDGMTGVCAPEFNQCTEFIDHADPSRDNPVGRSYYFLKNNRLDVTSCGGKVSLKDGCVLLENTDAIADVTYSTLATYCKSDPTIDKNCAKILSNANVSAGDQMKDGVAVAPVAGAKTKDFAQCKAMIINGLYTATDCEGQIAMLIKAGAQEKFDSTLCSNANIQSTVQLSIDGYRSLCSPMADSNTIVKVRRDRTCSEWLACQSSVSVYDKASQKFKEVCTDLGVCNKLSNDSGAVGQCANWVTPAQLSDPEKLQRALPLTTSRYVSRNVGWYGQEFSGYSLWKKFQPDTVGRFSVSEGGEMMAGVGFEDKTNCVGNAKVGAPCIAGIFNNSAVKSSIEAEFGKVTLQGQCFEQKCWYPIDGFKLADNAQAVDYTKSTCRGYPESDSPFPVSVAESLNMFGAPEEKAAGFKNANVCERYRAERLTRSFEDWSAFEGFKKTLGLPQEYLLVVNNASCDCSYKKVSYGDVDKTKYYALPNKENADALGKKVFIKSGGAWIEGAVVGVDTDTYKVQTSDATIPNIGFQDIAFVDGNKLKLTAGDFVVVLNADKKWYKAQVVKSPKGLLLEVKLLGAGLSYPEVDGLITLFSKNPTNYNSELVKSLETLSEKYTVLQKSIDAIFTLETNLKVKNVALNNAKDEFLKLLTNSANKTELLKLIDGGSQDLAAYIAVFNKDNGGAVSNDTIKVRMDEIISLRVSIQGLSNQIKTKITNLGESTGNAGKVTVNLKSEVAVVGKYATNSAPPAGICGGGWFVIGDKTGEKPNAISKVGLSCRTDFDCVDERVIRMKNPLNAPQQQADSDQIENVYNYQYSSDDGKCEFKKKETTVYGWEGYCLEKDLSAHINNNFDDRPCLLWLPVDVAGEDVYNQYKSAGYSVDSNGAGKYYCEESKGRLHAEDSKNSYVYGYSIDFNDQDYYGYNKVLTDLIDKNIYSSEIDYIEVVSKGADKNTFFPAGYTMKIQNDGKASIYQYTKTVEEWAKKEPYKSMKCAAWTQDNSHSQLRGYDYLDPTSDEKMTGEDVGIATGALGSNSQFLRLSALSEQIRCGGKEKGGLYLDQNCDYYSNAEKNIDDYFRCGGSEKKEVDYPISVDLNKRPMAITGVARANNKTYDNKDRIPQLANNKYGQIWFLRIDNQQYGKNSTLNEFGPSTFMLGDIINGDGNTGTIKTVRQNGACTYAGGNYKEDGADANMANMQQQGYELRFAFDSSGKLVAVDAGTCHGQTAPAKAGWDIKIHLRDACMKVVQTVDDAGKNAAYTNRLWQNYPASYEKTIDTNRFDSKNILVDAANNVKAVIARTQKYGSLAVLTNPVSLLYTFVENYIHTGIDFKDVPQTNESKGYSCPKGNCLTKADGTLAPQVTLTNGQAAVRSLFAKYYMEYSLAELSQRPEYQASESLVDNTAEGAKNAPVIFALDPSTCGGVRNGTCTMTKKYGVTINGVYGDNEVVFGKGSVAATMQFYGYANEDQMPLKRITVDWNDGKLMQKSGDYRNHKPVCSTQNAPVAVCKKSDGTIDYNHVCVSDKDCQSVNSAPGSCLLGSKDLKWSFGSWGGNGSSDEGACEPSYFQFSHAFTFDPLCGGVGKAVTATASDIDLYKLNGKVAIGERFCVFKPRVQLLDNWGACNGTPVGVAGMTGDGLKCNGSGKDFIDISTPFQGVIIVKE